MFRVDPKTVGRWALSGLLPSVRTPGGHRRYREADVRALLTPTDVIAVPFDGCGDCSGHLQERAAVEADRRGVSLTGEFHDVSAGSTRMRVYATRALPKGV